MLNTSVSILLILMFLNEVCLLNRLTLNTEIVVTKTKYENVIFKVNCPDKHPYK